jgi:hypothetical protein
VWILVRCKKPPRQEVPNLLSEGQCSFGIKLNEKKILVKLRWHFKIVLSAVYTRDASRDINELY